MALVSSKVAAGMVVLADQFNKLWQDMTANHDHSSGQGATVDHKNLSESDDMSGFNHRHEDLEIHLLGGGPGGNNIDNPGGSKGVHGLHSAIYECGGLASGATTPMVIQGGYDTLSSGAKAVTYPTSFSAVYSVVGTLINDQTQDNYPSDLYVTNVSTTGFTMHHTQPINNQFYWMALGTKT